MYIEFDIQPPIQSVLNDIKREIVTWAEQHHTRYTQKTIRHKHRLGFDHDSDFTLFAMTWAPRDLDQRPWLNFRIINIQNERY